MSVKDWGDFLGFEARINSGARTHLLTHLFAITAPLGYLEQGTPVGLVMRIGGASNIDHLHYSIELNGDRIDPLKVLRSDGNGVARGYRGKPVTGAVHPLVPVDFLPILYKEHDPLDNNSNESNISPIVFKEIRGHRRFVLAYRVLDSYRNDVAIDINLADYREITTPRSSPK